MKVIVGFDYKEIGSITTTPSGLKYTGNVKALKRMTEQMRRDMNDKKFVETLPSRFRGRAWAVLDGAPSNVEKFNPYHVPAGTPPGGQFTTREGGLFVATGQKKIPTGKFSEEQARITKQIDGLTKAYGTTFKTYFRSDDAKESARLKQQLDDLDALRNGVIRLRENNKRVSMDIAVKNLASDDPARSRRLQRALKEFRAG